MLCNLCRGSGWLMCCWPLEFHRCPKCAGNGATVQFGPALLTTPARSEERRAGE